MFETYIQGGHDAVSRRCQKENDSEYDNSACGWADMWLDYTIAECYEHHEHSNDCTFKGRCYFSNIVYEHICETILIILLGR